ncbi:hypothetical protein JCM17380_53610 [Desulfosporosinus burensis]
MVNRTLDIAITEKKLPDIYNMNPNENIILSSENIAPEVVPQLEVANIVILSPESIQERANKEGDFQYLRFSTLNNHFFQATVSLQNSWATAVNSNSKNVYLSGGGIKIWFFNILGKWLIFPNIEMWRS